MAWQCCLNYGYPKVLVHCMSTDRGVFAPSSVIAAWLHSPVSTEQSAVWAASSFLQPFISITN